jgi:competence protein ComEC
MATSEGQTIKFNKKASPIKPNAPLSTKTEAVREDTQIQNNNLTVYITKLGHKYHVAGCNSLSSNLP